MRNLCYTIITVKENKINLKGIDFMKVYISTSRNEVFTEKAFEEKVANIVNECIKNNDFYDKYFLQEVPSAEDYIADCDTFKNFSYFAYILINCDIHALEEIRRDFCKWCYDEYFQKLLRYEIEETELIGVD